MEINFLKLLSILGEDCIFYGNKQLIFNGIQSIYECKKGDITWIKQGVNEEEKLINESEASCILCSEDSFRKYTGSINNKLFVTYHDPKMMYLYVNKFISEAISPKVEYSFIHSTAIVDPNSKIGNNVQIGAYSIIGACTIGDGTIISEFVKIFDSVVIGKKCEIREQVTIGGKGLGYYKKDDGTLEHIPHLGKVLISDNVHLYPFVNIDQGTLGTTFIGKGSALDHHVHIGHNSYVGENSILVCGSVMAGGSKVLNNCFIGANTQIRQKCIIGNNVITGMGAIIVKDIPENQVWAGNPAVYLKESPKKLF